MVAPASSSMRKAPQIVRWAEENGAVSVHEARRLRASAVPSDSRMSELTYCRAVGPMKPQTTPEPCNQHSSNGLRGGGKREHACGRGRELRAASFLTRFMACWS